MIVALGVWGSGSLVGAPVLSRQVSRRLDEACGFSHAVPRVAERVQRAKTSRRFVEGSEGRSDGLARRRPRDPPRERFGMATEQLPIERVHSRRNAPERGRPGRAESSLCGQRHHTGEQLTELLCAFAVERDGRHREREHHDGADELEDGPADGAHRVRRELRDAADDAGDNRFRRRIVESACSAHDTRERCRGAGDRAADGDRRGAEASLDRARTAQGVHR